MSLSDAAANGRRGSPAPPTLSDANRNMRTGSAESLDKKGLSLGNSLLSEARRILKEDNKGEKGKEKRGNSILSARKAAAKEKWEIVRETLLGPEGHTMRESLSGNYKEVAQALNSGAAAGGGGSLLPPSSSSTRPLPPRYGAVDPVGLSSLEEGQAKQKRAATATATPLSLSRAESKEESLSQQPLSLQFAWRALKQVVMGRTLNLLLLTLPFGALSALLGWGAGPTFILNFLGLIPLAAILGDFTEEVAEHLGDTIGGLVNASFGNLMEMVIGVQALQQGEMRVVQASMLGSILSNLLLVTGSCFLVGGFIHREQRFNSVAGVANLSLLFLATMALVVPTPIGKSYNLSLHDVLLISRVAACFLLAMYLQLIVFQLVTHRHLFEAGDDDGDGDAGEGGGVTTLLAAAANGNGHGNGNGGGEGEGEEEQEEAAVPEPRVVRLVRHISSSFHHFSGLYHDDEGDLGDDDEDMVDLGLWGSMAGLCIVAFVSAFFSNELVNSIDGMSQAYGVSKTFVGIVLLPLVGNATEHMTAVTVAAKNRMELAMGIAVGSATQVALFVVPFLVISGWVMGRAMTLEFPPIEVVIFVMSVVLTMPVLLNAQSNWLIGSLLITCYCFCGFAFWFEQPGPNPGTHAADHDYKVHTHPAMVNGTYFLF